MKGENLMNKKDRAIRLFNSVRGRYIIGQALYTAIKEMEKVEYPFKEASNINDMKLMMAELFPMYSGIKNMKIKKIQKGEII
jgi:hypothetical protein